MTGTPLYLGAAYYPEHWPPERWPADIRLMQEAGLNVARLGEFAWSTLEPAEGPFQFDWLEQAVAQLAKAGISSVLGTPTAAPPAWLVQQSPDLLAVDENGRRVQFGNRCHYCVNSPEFHTAVQRLVSALGERFGANPHIIAWQIDNEFSRVCYCERCRALFQRFLAGRYGTLDVLNERWTTAYWSQTYSAWEQIPLPIGRHNPSLILDFKRFVTASYRRFQRLQIDSLRPHLPPHVPLTHNFMGWFERYDHYELAEDLDMAAWDWYVGSGHHNYLESGATHDLTRGFKRRSFWLIETQPGSVNWSQINNSLDKGEARAMAWHAIAHGAEAVLYWQWRSALGGQEQYHGTLVDQSGQPRPFYSEVQQLGREFAAVSDLLSGGSIRSQVAILNDYPSRWSIEAQRHHAGFDYVQHLLHYYRPLAARNLPVDIVSVEAPLDDYSLVIAPALAIITPERAANLASYVRNGGRLVLTLRTGMKDEANALLPSRQPGPLVELAGVEVEEYYALLDPVPVKGNWFEGAAQTWAERLKVLDPKRAIVIARYGPSNGWLDGEVAITISTFGHGLVYLVGAYLEDAAQEALLGKILKDAGLNPVKTPEGVELRTLHNRQDQDVVILINHDRQEKTLWLPWPAYDHLGGTEIQAELKLPAFGVVVLTRR